MVEELKACRFNKCDSSGLIPFKKGEKIIPDAYLFCDCHPQYGIDTQEQLLEAKPEDFDFPMSAGFRAYVLEQNYGEVFANQEMPIKQELSQKENSSYIDKNNIYNNKCMGDGKFKQLQGLVLYLQSKLNEHLDQAKTKSQPKYK